MNTPWGYADYTKHLDGTYNGQKVVLDDLIQVSTAGHGGIGLKVEANSILSNYAKCIAIKEGGYYWFEEDCNWPIVILEFEKAVPNAIDSKMVEIAKEVASEWHEEWHKDYSTQ